MTNPVTMDAGMIGCLADVAEEHFSGQWQRMPSAAMHDANMFAPVMPTGMIFVPSKGGISHNLLEDTDEADLIKGCQLAANAVVEILTRFEKA